jgi:hypothetical protein
VVNGEIVYRDGKFTRSANPDRVFAEAERIGARLIEQAGLSHRFAPAWRA